MQNLIPRSVNRNLLLLIMLVSSTMSVVLLFFRIYFTGTLNYIFLGWNLFLAWIPYLCAISIQKSKNIPNRKYLTYSLFGIWILFLPNAPYILTDLFHLHFYPGIPLWYDLFLLIFFAWNGLMLGFFSLIIVQQWLSEHFNHWITWSIVTVLMFLCSYGVYLGRFGRWNSWDVVSNGKDLVLNFFHDLFYPFQNLRMLGVTLIFGVFLLLGYITLLALMSISKNEK